MKKSLERKYLLIAIVGFIIILFTLTGGLIFGPFNHILPDNIRIKLGYKTEIGTELAVRLVVNFNGEAENVNETIFFLVNQTATAYSILLAANLTIKSTIFQEDVFIEAINGIEQNTTHFWWYLVDGIDGGLASNKYDLRSNKIECVTWIFKTAEGSKNE